MPLYDYQCQQCAEAFTELRRSSEMDAPIDCPECGSRETQRTLSAFAVGCGGGSGMPFASGVPAASAATQSPFS